jgi:MYXO-CTERM domain-containing protein
MPVRAPQEEPAHDVLAAEEFAVPAPDPALRHDPISLPEDPTGIAEPHDVLAAEEFAMPVGPRSAGSLSPARSPGRAALAALALALLLVLRRRRQRR